MKLSFLGQYSIVKQIVLKMKIDNFLKHLSRLDNVHQWEERDSVIKESVSQHSFKVAAICHFMLNEYEKSAKKFCSPISNDWLERYNWLEFKYECLSYAVLHDFDEAILGRDISHVVKYNDFNGEEIRKAINNYVNHITKEDFAVGSIPQPTQEVKYFVKMCDWIALSTFCDRNLTVGCMVFTNEYTYCNDNLSEAISIASNSLEKKFQFNPKDIFIKIVDLKIDKKK